MTHFISGRSIRTGSSIWCSCYPTRVHITESVLKSQQRCNIFKMVINDDSFCMNHIIWVILTRRIRWVLEAFESHLRGNSLIGCWLNDIYFRWLKIKGFDTEFPISITLFSKHLNWEAVFTQTRVNWCFFHFSFIVTAFTSGHFGFISGRSTEQKFRKFFFDFSLFLTICFVYLFVSFHSFLLYFD